MTTSKLIKAIKQKITAHQHGCCHCGGTPTAKAEPLVMVQPRRDVTTEKGKN